MALLVGKNEKNAKLRKLAGLPPLTSVPTTASVLGASTADLPPGLNPAQIGGARGLGNDPEQLDSFANVLRSNSTLPASMVGSSSTTRARSATAPRSTRNSGRVGSRYSPAGGLSAGPSTSLYSGLGSPSIMGGRYEVDRSAAIRNPLLDAYSRLAAISSPEAVAEREKRIRREVGRERQRLIDSINLSAQQDAAAEQALGDQRLAQQRSINLRAGLAGSDFGAANKDAVKKGTKQAVAAINADRDVAIFNAMNQIEETAMQRIKMQEDSLIGGAQANIAAITELRNNAVNSIAELGKSGADLNTIKQRDPDLYNSIQQASGMGDLELEAVLNNNKPPQEKIAYQYKVAGGKIFAYGVNPNTGELVTLEQDANIPDGYEISTMPNGAVLGVPKDWDGDTSKIVTVGNYAKPTGGGGGASGDPVVDAWVDQIQAGKATISNVPASLKNAVVSAMNSDPAMPKSDLGGAQDILTALEELKNHPGKKLAIGKSSLFNVVPGTNGASFINKLDTLKSKLTLPNLSVLKGAMSDKDIQFISQAGTSLAASNTEADFNAELDKMISKLRQAATASGGNVVRAPDGTLVEIID